MAASRTIVVAGAGIGGLTAALSLAAQGFRVVVLEKAERLEEAGAGLQLSPNASRVLIELGLAAAARRAGGDPRSRQHHERARRRRNLPAAARRGRHLSRRRALLGGASRRPAGRAGGSGRRPSRYRAAARLPVRGRRRACQGTDGGPAQRRRAPPGTGDRADRRRRHLVHGPATSVSGGEAAILRADRLARHARRHPAAARIHLAPGPALDGAERPSRRLSDLGRAPDQRRRRGAGHLEPAGLERARRGRRNQERVRLVPLARPGADDARRRRRLAQMGAVHGARGRRLERRRGRAAGRRRPRHAAVCRARRRHGDRGCGGAGESA